MRKVILVDGTAIKARFKGVLLAASMQDANLQVYPILFGIVDAENEPAWTWFFQQLSQILPDAEDLVLVTDRHRSIYAAVGQIYPKAFHGCCAVHLERNVKVRWARYGIPGLVRKAARAFNVGQFKAHYNEIRAQSGSCFQYLEAIPKEHWTQAYCPAKRYNIMSSNIAEALNAALAKILELPLVTMVDGIRGKLMRWFCLRRAKAATLKDPITPNANKMLLEHNVHFAGLAVIQVSELFAKQYEAMIYPVPNQADEEVPAAVEETQLVPPDVKRAPGRRRTRRIPSAGENVVGAKRQKTGRKKVLNSVSKLGITEPLVILSQDKVSIGWT
ncbi:putative MULE transposase domain-containing protein [Arabidopsis thaliana]